MNEKLYEEKEKNARKSSFYVALVIGIIAAYILAYGYAAGDTLGDGLNEAFNLIITGHIFFIPTLKSLIGIIFGAGIGFLIYLGSMFDFQRRDHYQDDAVAGTGGFMTEKDLAEYKKENFTEDPPAIPGDPPVPYDPVNDKTLYSQNMIMSQNFTRPIDSRSIPGNNNLLVVGGAGSGKSRYLIKPNILQMNASYVITDPSGEMIQSMGNVLKNHGYKILIFNLSDMAHSNCYNPFAYIRDEAGVDMVIECLIRNTNSGQGKGDPFFENAEKLLYAACIYYLKDFCPDVSKKNFAGVMSIINASNVNESDPNAKSPVDKLFEGLPKSSLAWKNYAAFKQGSGKTLKSILISCVTRLRPFLTPQVANLTKTDSLHLERFGLEKTALFIITPQADDTYNFLTSMLYSQLFETLYHVAEERKAETGDERLPIPVRCLMDEFANTCEVPKFPSKLATMRKYNISATVVLQDNSQIDAMYQDESKSIVGNCSSIVFLGSSEPDTLDYYSKKLGKMTIKTRSSNVSTSSSKGSSSQGFQNTGREVLTPEELGRIPPEDCVVYTQSYRPVYDEKYHYESHPYYSQTGDADVENSFRYKEMPIYDNSKNLGAESLMKARVEAARIREADQKEKQEVKNAKKVTLQDANEDVHDKISFGKTQDEEEYRKQVSSAVAEVYKVREDTPCVILVEGVALNNLSRLVTQVSSQTQKKDLVVFDDTTIKEDESFIYGMTLNNEQFPMEDILNTTYTKEMESQDGYIVVKISKYMLDRFTEEVKSNYKKLVCA